MWTSNAGWYPSGEASLLHLPKARGCYFYLVMLSGERSREATSSGVEASLPKNTIHAGWASNCSQP